MEKKVTVNWKLVEEIAERKAKAAKDKFASKEEVVNKVPEYEDRFVFSSQPIPYQKHLPNNIDYFDEKRIGFDLDKTIAKPKGPTQNYDDVEPMEGAVKALKALKKQGWYIVICTARNMRTYQHNIGQVNAKQTPLIVNWLNRWGIPFDEIWVKPHVEFFVDDKAIEFDNWLKFKQDLSDKMIRNKIAVWHNGVTGTSNQELHEWLGWSWEEYKKYVEFKTIPERDLVIK